MKGSFLARSVTKDPFITGPSRPTSSGAAPRRGNRPVVAEHADLWNFPGGDDLVERSALLDRYCEDIGRDPASITRSIPVPVSYDRPATTRSAIEVAAEAGFRHIVLSLPAPYPAGVARWVADELIRPMP
jgi:alkanesulfonate monooxygenase SsuD/methylene tetrahydromethanopterin reductase-like flavin-dependent oxidoreductase (luciferase family)